MDQPGPNSILIGRGIGVVLVITADLSITSSLLCPTFSSHELQQWEI